MYTFTAEIDLNHPYSSKNLAIMNNQGKSAILEQKSH